MSWIDPTGTRRRDCCDTTYNCTHRDDCPEWGIEARAAKPCAITLGGWCATHSTAAGPAYCAPVHTPQAAQAAREQEAQA